MNERTVIDGQQYIEIPTDEIAFGNACHGDERDGDDVIFIKAIDEEA